MYFISPELDVLLVNVLYEEICPRSLADLTVNILAVSFYLVVELNFYPSLHRPMSVREHLQQEWRLPSLKNVMLDIPRRERTALTINSFGFPSTAENSGAQILLVSVQARWV